MNARKLVIAATSDVPTRSATNSRVAASSSKIRKTECAGKENKKVSHKVTKGRHGGTKEDTKARRNDFSLPLCLLFVPLCETKRLRWSSRVTLAYAVQCHRVPTTHHPTTESKMA